MICRIKTKILCALLVSSIILSIGVCAFAANTVNITSAQTKSGTNLSDTAEGAPELETTDKITVNLSAQAGANITIFVIDASIDVSADTISASDIIYINQQKLSSQSSSYIFAFDLPENIAPATYAVYVGGDQINAPATKYFKIPSPVTAGSYVSGDFDKDGKADLVDAIQILRYIKASVSSSTVAYDIVAGDVNADGNITNDDAKYIMHYILGITLPEGVSVGEQLSYTIMPDI
ncbi:MAG: hypothetical protein E7410_03945 [Ruminococcaceae bacterium]|nr:hypothetical protein [Oscillospiraceae bacterium]